MPPKVIGNKILVKLEEDQWMYIKKPDTIIIPESVEGGFKKRSQWGTIVSLGNECRNKLNIGDKVYFKWLDHRPGITQYGQDYRIIMENEILIINEVEDARS